MNPLEQHEIFEMEILDRLKSSRMLESLVFGGGTMLRLCHELPRYSVDLDFWKLKPRDDQQFLTELREEFEQHYEITDSRLKRFTILLELRTPQYPKRLKIEIRRELKDWEFEDKIAFSPFSTKQVMLKAHTLKQTMLNKVEALINRGAIRDAFDIEFLLRKGLPLPTLTADQSGRLLERIQRFKPNDFKVALGSVIERDWREYYIQNGFKLLEEKVGMQ
ncbi:MAG: hypothetical protein D6732_02975 [Methanobacteriota archaeon]|nr:MAG: hypothetical protein D6732_02975 [Euryarchaeota archaeon]